MRVSPPFRASLPGPITPVPAHRRPVAGDGVLPAFLREHHVSESTPHPPLEDLLVALEHLADRVQQSQGPRLDPFVTSTLRRVEESLRRYVPGLDLPPDPDAARFLARAAFAALEDNDAREAMARALRGLSFAPHHPGLFYVVASACFEFGAVEDAIRLLRHTLWIHPGHAAARHDLEALVAYRDGKSRDGVELPDWASEPPGGPELAFDFADDPLPPHDVFDDEQSLPWDEGEDRAA